jgi:isoaspartyl peptidase/L-asparaginase-like protein (Ntn-hydrolase superfamily)
MQTLFAATWWFGQVAVEAAWDHWQSERAQGGNGEECLFNAVVEGAAAVEMDLRVNSVGVGGLPNAMGEVELDAALMEGKTMRAGAVAGIRHYAPSVYLARAVMEKTRHVMLMGEGAERFAAAQGFEPRCLLTDVAVNRWYEWNAQRIAPQETSHERVPNVHKQFSLTDAPEETEDHDTVGVIGWHQGHCVAACTTSGMAWKLPGRVGDSPIFGAGLYADNEAGAAVATGVGEEIWRFTLSSRVVENMRKGRTAQEACEDAIQFMLRRKPENAHAQAALIGVRADGDHGAYATQPDKFPAFFCIDGQLKEFLPEMKE